MSRAGVRGRRIPTTDVRGWMDPMLATLVPSLPDSAGFVFERKLDGIRALAYRDASGIRLYSRNKLPLEASFPEVVRALERLPQHRFVLDGEVVAYQDGDAVGFQHLQERPGAGGLRYYLFDVLSLERRDLRSLSLAERQRVLADTFRAGGVLRKTTAVTGDAERLRADACARGWEGLIAKRADSPYRGGRSRDWLKLKCVNEQEFVVGGFTDPKGSRTGFGALLIGVYAEGSLRFSGEVGTGFNDRTLRELGSRLRALEIAESPFSDHPRARKGQHFVRPELVAQVRFTEWTRDGKLRHPTFVGLRTDKVAREVVRER